MVQWKQIAPYMINCISIVSVEPVLLIRIIPIPCSYIEAYGGSIQRCGINANSPVMCGTDECPVITMVSGGVCINHYTHGGLDSHQTYHWLCILTSLEQSMLHVLMPINFLCQAGFNCEKVTWCYKKCIPSCACIQAAGDIFKMSSITKQ